MEKILQEIHEPFQTEHGDKRKQSYLLLYHRNGDVYETVGMDDENCLFTTAFFKFEAYLADCHRLILRPVHPHTMKLSLSISVAVSSLCGFQWVSPQVVAGFYSIHSKGNQMEIENEKNIQDARPSPGKKKEGSKTPSRFEQEKEQDQTPSKREEEKQQKVPSKPVDYPSEHESPIPTTILPLDKIKFITIKHQKET